MGKLADKMKQILIENNLGYAVTPPVLRSGIDILDYRNGRISYDKNGKKNILVGFDVGKIIGIIGKPGSSKTTLAIQMMDKMGSYFDDSVIYHYDFEQSTNDERILALTKKDKSYLTNKYLKLNSQIYQESVHDLIMKIREVKLGKPSGPKTKIPGSFDNKIAEEWLVPNPENPSEKVMIPTFLLIDSIAVMMPREINLDEEQGTNMLAAAVAKANANMFRKITGDLCNTATTLIYVNHITKKISINPRQPVTADINYLDADENMPGGVALRYLTNTLIKLRPGRKLVDNEEFGINGFIVEAKFIKCRSNRAGVTCNLVYNQIKGYSNILSNYLLLKEAELVKGGGRGFYLTNLPDIKFTQKDIESLYKTNKNFKKAFDELVAPVLESFIPETDDDDNDIEVEVKNLSKFSKKEKEENNKEEFIKLSKKEIRRLPKTTIEIEDEDGDSEDVECYYDEENEKYYYIDTLEEIV